MRIFPISQKYKELLLSHHPDLPCFQDDVIIRFNRRICAGCLLGYPAAIITLMIFQPFWQEGIFLSLFFALISQTRRLSPRNRLLQHYCRILAGIALGFGFGGLVWAFAYQQWFWGALLVFGALFYFGMRIIIMKKKIDQYYPE